MPTPMSVKIVRVTSIIIKLIDEAQGNGPKNFNQ